MNSQNTDSSRGFTIIEILIVLVIAGMILALVLLAIPTLQRNSRNSQRKQDVSSILEAISHWESNNSGTIPTQAELTTYLQDYAKLYYYNCDACQISIQPLLALQAAPANTPDLDIVYLYNHQKCDSTAPDNSTFVGAGYNDIVALYSVEDGGGNASGKCQQI